MDEWAYGGGQFLASQRLRELRRGWMTVAGPRWIRTSFLIPLPCVAPQASHTPVVTRAGSLLLVLTYDPPVSIPAVGSGRAPSDRCPGVLRLVEAADGKLARIRLPGGFVSAAQLQLLARLAAELGDGRVELTSRGNVQLRALPEGAVDPLTVELQAAGLLPSLDHDRVRNVLASPLAGLADGMGLEPVVRAFDAALCARSRLAELPGRFLSAVDDGTGDVAGLGADVVAQVQADGNADGWNVNGLLTTDPVAAMLGFAEAFLDERAAQGSAAWRIADLPGGADRVRAAVATELDLSDAQTHLFVAPQQARPVGLVAADTVVLLAPLGRLNQPQVDWLADHLDELPARITPWRSVVLPNQHDATRTLDEAAGQGFGVDAASPWLRVTACAGKPGCASALADVQADASAFAVRWPDRVVHVSGCDRRCGRPTGTDIDVIATSEGYQVAGI